jgi:hypothetical protein
LRLEAAASSASEDANGATPGRGGGDGTAYPLEPLPSEVARTKAGRAGAGRDG